jgi:hypothetical protein
MFAIIARCMLSPVAICLACTVPRAEMHNLLLPGSRGNLPPSIAREQITSNGCSQRLGRVDGESMENAGHDGGKIYQESNRFQTASAADREAWLRCDDLLSWSVRIHNIYVYL